MGAGYRAVSVMRKRPAPTAMNDLRKKTMETPRFQILNRVIVYRIRAGSGGIDDSCSRGIDHGISIILAPGCRIGARNTCCARLVHRNDTVEKSQGKVSLKG